MTVLGSSQSIANEKYQGLRQSLVERFPYAIFYLVEEEKKQVVIFGVLHTNRDPEMIRKRKK